MKQVGVALIKEMEELIIKLKSIEERVGEGGGPWREISSCSTFTDFQARRMGLRYAKTEGTRAVAHDQRFRLRRGKSPGGHYREYQDAGGTVIVPDALRLYLKLNRLI